MPFQARCRSLPPGRQRRAVPALQLALLTPASPRGSSAPTACCSWWWSSLNSSACRKAGQRPARSGCSHSSRSTTSPQRRRPSLCSPFTVCCCRTWTTRVLIFSSRSKRWPSSSPRCEQGGRNHGWEAASAAALSRPRQASGARRPAKRMSCSQRAPPPPSLISPRHPSKAFTLADAPTAGGTSAHEQLINWKKKGGGVFPVVAKMARAAPNPFPTPPRPLAAPPRRQSRRR